MGSRGPDKTPTDVLVARGSWRGRARHNAEQEAQRLAAQPPPFAMTGDARTIWLQQERARSAARDEPHENPALYAVYLELIAKRNQLDDLLMRVEDALGIEGDDDDDGDDEGTTD